MKSPFVIGYISPIRRALAPHLGLLLALARLGDAGLEVLHEAHHVLHLGGDDGNIWQCVKTNSTPGKHQNSWYLDVHPPKNGIFIGIDPYPYGNYHLVMTNIAMV